VGSKEGESDAGKDRGERVHTADKKFIKKNFLGIYKKGGWKGPQKQILNSYSGGRVRLRWLSIPKPLKGG